MKKRGSSLFYNLKKDIPLILDSYDDLFSDFDPRPYSQRALSKDFLIECQKASEDKKGDIEVKLLIDRKERNSKDEVIIIERIKDHFRKHFHEKSKELFKMRAVGMTWFLVGCFFIVFTTLLNVQDTSFLIRLLIAVAHPGGWFFMWEGMGKVLIHTKEKRGEHLFNKKMTKAKISFLNK